MPMFAPPPVALPLVGGSAASKLLYTCPAGLTVVVEVILANTDTANQRQAFVSWNDVAPAAASGPLCQNKIDANDTIVSPQKTLEAGDFISAYADAAGTITASVNVIHTEAA